MQTFDSGKRVNAACNKRVSSFALFEGADFVCYQCTSNFHEEEALYKSAMADLRKFFASCSEVVRGNNVSLFCFQLCVLCQDLYSLSIRVCRGVMMRKNSSMALDRLRSILNEEL